MISVSEHLTGPRSLTFWVKIPPTSSIQYLRPASVKLHLAIYFFLNHFSLFIIELTNACCRARGNSHKQKERSTIIHNPIPRENHRIVGLGFLYLSIRVHLHRSFFKKTPRKQNHMMHITLWHVFPLKNPNISVYIDKCTCLIMFNCRTVFYCSDAVLRLFPMSRCFQEFALTSKSVDEPLCPRRDNPIGCWTTGQLLDPGAGALVQCLLCIDELPFGKLITQHPPTSFLWKHPFPHNFLAFPFI